MGRRADEEADWGRIVEEVAKLRMRRLAAEVGPDVAFPDGWRHETAILARWGAKKNLDRALDAIEMEFNHRERVLDARADNEIWI